MINCSQKTLKNVKINTAVIQLNRKKVTVIQLVDEQGFPYSWLTIAKGLLENLLFRYLWNQTLAEMPFDFQCKPVPIHPEFAKNYPFFVVLVPSSFPASNASAYRQYLNQLSIEELITTFPNLSGDALLLIPKDTGNYGHIVSFCRNADDKLIQTLWKEVGKLTYQAIINEEVMWCNTHGHGVPWMHIRFDKTLKYAVFPPYGIIDETSQKQWYETIYLKVFK
ncbi:MAG: hypothetical protein AB4060_20780 [Crocosphaera sp.]